MPVQSTLRHFRVLRTLRYLGQYGETRWVSNTPKHGDWRWEEQAKKVRDAYVIRKMRKHFSEEEVQAVLRYRRSDGSDEAVIADFFKNDQPTHYIPRDYHYQRALRVVADRMRPNRPIHPVSFPDLRAYDAELTTSAELPWTNNKWHFKPQGRDFDLETGKPRVNEFSESRLRKFDKGTRVKPYLRWKQELGLIKDSDTSYHNLYNEIFQVNRQWIHQIKEGEAPFWKDGLPVPHEALNLHLRTHVVHESKPDKVRAVFGAPKLLLHSELMFIWPLQATYQLNDNVGKLLWGREIGRGGWIKLLNEFVPNNTFISMDWSEFDRRLLHELIRDVHTIWRSYFDFSRYESTTRYHDAQIPEPERIERLWKWMTSSITDTPILLPNGQLWNWTHNGFGSGYQQTQLMDTFCNMIMTYTVLSSLGINIEAEGFKSRFQGDDGILAFRESVAFRDNKNFLTRMKEKGEYYFNAKLSDEKSSIGQHPNSMYVLGYNNRSGMPFREEDDLLSHLMFPERPQDFGRLTASAVGLAFAALGCSERFHNLCQDIFDDQMLWRKGVGFKRRDWKALKWMKKAGMENILEQVKNAQFPSYLHTMSAGITPHTMDAKERDRHWPMIERGVRGEIVFLEGL